MKTKKYWILAFLVLVVCSVFWHSVSVRGSGESDALERHKQIQRSTLRGLEGVAIIVFVLVVDLCVIGIYKALRGKTSKKNK